MARKEEPTVAGPVRATQVRDLALALAAQFGDQARTIAQAQIAASAGDVRTTWTQIFDALEPYSGDKGQPGDNG